MKTKKETKIHCIGERSSAQSHYFDNLSLKTNAEIEKMLQEPISYGSYFIHTFETETAYLSKLEEIKNGHSKLYNL